MTNKEAVYQQEKLLKEYTKKIEGIEKKGKYVNEKDYCLECGNEVNENIYMPSRGEEIEKERIWSEYLPKLQKLIVETEKLSILANAIDDADVSDSLTASNLVAGSSVKK